VYVLFWKEIDVEHQYKHSFGCESGFLPIWYLGVPIHIENCAIPNEILLGVILLES
jgi:hypothetical protein